MLIIFLWILAFAGHYFSVHCTHATNGALRSCAREHNVRRWGRGDMTVGEGFSNGFIDRGNWYLLTNYYKPLHSVAADRQKCGTLVKFDKEERTNQQSINWSINNEWISFYRVFELIDLRHGGYFTMSLWQIQQSRPYGYAQRISNINSYLDFP